MTYYTFDEYWKNFGKFNHYVIKNDRKLEQDFYELAKKVWLDMPDCQKDAYGEGHWDGWGECENHYGIKSDD